MAKLRWQCSPSISCTATGSYWDWGWGGLHSVWRLALCPSPVPYSLALNSSPAYFCNTKAKEKSINELTHLTDLQHNRNEPWTTWPMPKGHSPSCGPRPHVQGRLWPPLASLYCAITPQNHPRSAKNRVAHICIPSKLSIVHIPDPSLATAMAQASSIWRNLGHCGCRCY